MKRPRQIILRTLAVLSLLSCIATAVLWVLSYKEGQGIVYSWSNGNGSPFAANVTRVVHWIAGVDDGRMILRRYWASDPAIVLMPETGANATSTLPG